VNAPRSLPHASTLAAGAILVIMFLFGALRYDHFASPSTLSSLLNDYAFVGIAAIGATLVILSGGIDLSAGAVIACTSILIASLISRGIHPLLAWTIALVAGTAFGALQGWLIHAFRLPAFMVTLAGMFAARASGFLIHEQSLPITHAFYTTTRTANLPLGFGAELSLGTLLFLITLLIAWFFATRTSPGRRIYALGGHERSARVMGLPIARTRITTYTLAGFCSALAGCAFTMYKESGDPASAIGLELDIIAAVVIGGTLLSGGVGSLWGTLVGILILGLIRKIIDFEGTLSAAWTGIATGLLLLLFVGLQRGTALLGGVGRRVRD
jgi:ribose/xylose/arabinose/galactoside ABC-type transport system permease subunit